MNYNLPLGITLSLLAALGTSSQAAIIKAMIAHLPPIPVIIFFQSFMSLLLILPFLFKKGIANTKKIFVTNDIKLQILRTIFSLTSAFLLFYAVTFIPLTHGMLLANSTPLIIPFIGFLFLSQKINHRLWIPIIIGYLGIIIILHPDATILKPASLLALCAACSMASSMLIVRKLSTIDTTETTVFYFFLFSTLISGLIAIKFWIPLTREAMTIIMIIAFIYFLAQYLATLALRYINAQLLASLYYSNIIFAVIISFFVWHILPTMNILFGMILTIGGGILCIRIEYATKKRSINQGELQYVKEN